MSEGLAQSPYLATRAGVEPMTLRTKGVDSTNAPPTPHNVESGIKLTGGPVNNLQSSIDQSILLKPLAGHISCKMYILSYEGNKERQKR